MLPQIIREAAGAGEAGSGGGVEGREEAAGGWFGGMFG